MTCLHNWLPDAGEAFDQCTFCDEVRAHFDAMDAVSAYCGRTFDTYPAEVIKAIVVTDRAGHVTAQAAALCDPWRNTVLH